jgi:drug/metabolite transporter (DMT)-like permease
MIGIIPRASYRMPTKGVEVLRIRSMKYGDTYRPFYAIGRWIFLLCLLFMAFAAITGIIPDSLQFFAVTLVSAIMILSGILAVCGGLKSFDKSAYPIFLAAIVIAFVVMTLWALGQSP